MDPRPFQISKPLSELYLRIAGGGPSDPASVRASYEAALAQAYATTDSACVAEVRRYEALLGLFVPDLAHYHADWLPDTIAPAELHGISVVSVSMNRTPNLLLALRSWLALTNIAEIVVVDWASADPLSNAIQHAGIADPRLRIIRVENEYRWILTHAFNLAFRLSRGSAILKLDADIVLTPDFLSCNPLPSGKFLAGNWRNARQGQSYVNGVFLAPRCALMQVGGFNEFITTYGWDDEDLYARLGRSGYARHDIDPESVKHLAHDDASRTGTNTEGVAAKTLRSALQASPRYLIHHNRFLTRQMPTWSAAQIMTPFCHSPDGSGNLRRALPVCPSPPSEMQDRASAAALDYLLQKRFGPQIETISPLKRAELLNSPAENVSIPVYSPALNTARARFVIDARHGLGNRLRAIASAAAIAQATDRELIILWQPDDHCNCRFEDLFDYSGAVLDESFVTDAAKQGMTVLNYMSTEAGAAKGAPVPDFGDLYLRSAFTLNSPFSTWRSENAFLQTLTPTEDVLALVASVARPYRIAAHVRMQGGAMARGLSYESAAGNWTPEDHAAITHWRAQSQPDRFLKRIATLEQDSKEPIFLASDNADAYSQFATHLGDRLLSLPRTLHDRSAEQLRYALADALVLARAPILLGSTWSSFTELARRLSSGPQHFETSGRDF